jgi:hypothetical protein
LMDDGTPLSLDWYKYFVWCFGFVVLSKVGFYDGLDKLWMRFSTKVLPNFYQSFVLIAWLQIFVFNVMWVIIFRRAPN